MKLVIDMPWERDLSVNHCRMGPQGNWHLKPHVEAWMDRLAWELRGTHIEAMARDFGEGLKLICSLPLHVVVDFRFPDKHRRDSHNYFKVVCDSVEAAFGIDDKDIRISTGSVTVDRERPGFRIEVSDETPD